MPTGPKRFPFRPAAAAKPRASTTDRGYGTEHQKAREHVLARNPVCQRCDNAFSTDLHHIDGDTFNRAHSNLLAVCEDCHLVLDRARRYRHGRVSPA